MASFSKEPIRILIIEDDQDWVAIIHEILPGNFHFDVACNIEEVKDLIQKNTYNLIIADLLLSDAESPVFGIFKDFSNLIFAIKQTKLQGRLWPPIIIITIHQIHSQVPKLLNHYGGWVWGWHEKQGFDINAFHRNVEAAIATKETFEKSLKMPDEWTFRDLLYVLSHMTMQGWGAITGVVGFLLTLSYYVGVWTS